MVKFINGPAVPEVGCWPICRWKWKAAGRGARYLYRLPRPQALCHYQGLSQDVSGLILPIDAVRTSGVVTEGLSGLQASGGKGFTKDSCSVAFVTRC